MAGLRAEAKTELPPRYAKYKPCGGEFLLQLADGPTVGTPATETNLRNWTKKYAVDFPATIDPSYKLGALFQADAYPANIIIDTTNTCAIVMNHCIYCSSRDSRILRRS